MSAIAATVQAFFTEYLMRQRQASPHTIAAYRDLVRMLLVFATGRTGIPSHQLQFTDLDAVLITAFLDDLEYRRGNSVRTRNARLAGIHSLYGYAATHHPEHAGDIQRVLAIPAKRAEHTIITYLTEAEADALLAAPDRNSRTGRRDHALLQLAIQTGLRASELTSLTCRDVHLGTGAHIRCRGKGRKDRITPLTHATVTVMRAWISERAGNETDPLFPTNRDAPMSLDALAQRVRTHATTAAGSCRSLGSKNVTPHVLRHTAAMRLLHAGVDTTVIALWLGHVDVATTHIYLEADLTLKQRALDRTAPPTAKPGRYHPPDQLIAFLEAL